MQLFIIRLLKDVQHFSDAFTREAAHQQLLGVSGQKVGSCNEAMASFKLAMAAVGNVECMHS
jgi:hypothetical protein